MSEWKVPRSVQPKADDYGFDLDTVLSAVVGLSATVPTEAFTAETLGTERAGSGVVIRENGLILTIGYLITEAETVWLHLPDGQVVAGDVVAVDQESGLGLVQALTALDLPSLPFGSAAAATTGSQIIVAGAGGRQRSVSARIVAKQPFAGYWEYLLEEALFTSPGHPNWGGTAVIGTEGELLAIGSLQLQPDSGRRGDAVNMAVPIDLLVPVLDELCRTGTSSRPARPWIGVYVAEIEGQVVIADVMGRSPADQAGLQPGDVITSVGDKQPHDLAALFRAIWDQGAAGVTIPLGLQRTGRYFTVQVASTDRRRMFRRPRLH